MTTPPDPNTTSKGPNALLAGLGLGTALFAATICTAALFLFPALGRQLNVASSARPAWTPPAPTAPPRTTPHPTGEPTPTATPDANTSQTNEGMFKAGDTVINVNPGPVNLRKTPGYLNKPPSDRIALVPGGAQLTILGGPEQADGLTWWRVRWKDLEGWMAQNRASGGPILAPPTP